MYLEELEVLKKYNDIENRIPEITKIINEYRKKNPADRQETIMMRLAQFVSTWSKDPSTKTGAVIYKVNHCDPYIISIGYNRFPKGVKETEERYNNRELKYKIISHCEREAILYLLTNTNENLNDCVLVTYPFRSCAVCAGVVIQSGIKYCIAPEETEEQRNRWGKDFELTNQMFDEAGVKLQLVNYNIL